MTNHTYQSVETGRPATPQRILSVSTATFWRAISYAYRSAAIDHQALINRSGCINGYKIRNADLTVLRWRDVGLDQSFNGIIMMLWFLVNNNGIMMALCPGVETIENDSHYH